ncbi:FecR domain-containing protein [soil metagenome]
MIIPADIEEKALQWFVLLSDVDAPESAWLGFTDWLEADAAHASAYAAVERMWSELDAVSDPSPAIMPSRRPANDDAPVRGTIARRKGRPAWLYPTLAAAAAVIVVVGAWPILIPGVSTQGYQTTDAPRTIVLSDGSQIDMNRHSDLTVRMASSHRDVVLKDGEAAFDVTHDSARPFVIRSGDHDVRVLGTAFNVLNHDGHFSVGVRRGVVAVTPSGQNAVVRLTAGQKIDQAGSSTPVMSQTDPAGVSAWRGGVLIYRNSTLGEVAQDLSRYLDKPVTVSPSAQPLRFTGALQVGDEARMLEQLQEFLPIGVTRSSTTVRLTRRDGL